MKIGLVCPYSPASPGGVQRHVLGLAETLRERGHRVSVLLPGGSVPSSGGALPADGEQLPAYCHGAGRPISLRFNGSVARVSFGPGAYYAVGRWLGEHDFDVLHLHDPMAPSLSMLALMQAHGPVVATFHTSTARSRLLLGLHGTVQPLLERITVRVAVSEVARGVLREHAGADAVVIPNGIRARPFREAQPLPGYRTGATVGFLGRFDEPRKGLPILLEAMEQVMRRNRDARLLLVGPGDARALRRRVSATLNQRMHVLGQVSEPGKRSALRSMDLLCLPNTGGESFGIVLAEGMAAGVPLVASDIPGFRAVLGEGRCGYLVPPGEVDALTAGLESVLGDSARRAQLRAAGRDAVAHFEWSGIVRRLELAYETACAANSGRAGGREVARSSFRGGGSRPLPDRMPVLR